MKKMNLLAMSLVSAAALSFSSCSSNDDLAGGGTQSQADGVYMTLKISGATSHGTRTSVATPNTEENGTVDESTITEGMMYIYEGNTCVFRKVITAGMFQTAPTQTSPGVTKPIKVAVTGQIKTDTEYSVYFLANNTSVKDPLAANASFTSANGGAEFATDNKFVMFNQYDASRDVAASKVTFTDKNKSEATPARAGEIKLDRVVARIDKPTFKKEVTTVTPTADTKTSINAGNVIEGITLEGYAVSNLNNTSYVKQNWTQENTDWTLNVLTTGTPKYYLNKDTYGTKYKPDGLANFGEDKWKYAFENTTTNVDEATAVYFKVKATLKEAANNTSDFRDGTFYRYDGRLYTSIQAIYNDAATGAISNPFTETNSITPAKVVEMISDTNGNLTTDEGKLAKFRQDYKIEVYRQGVMYYRWAISDNAYKPFVANDPTHTYSVLRNSIYRLTVTKVSEIGKDVPNGPEPDDPDKNPNFYMNVTVKINPWVLNTKDIELK